MKRLGLASILCCWVALAMAQFSPQDMPPLVVSDTVYSSASRSFHSQYVQSPKPGGATWVKNTANVTFKAGKGVNLKPGFHASDLGSGGFFHAELQPLPFEVVWFEPDSHVGQVGKYDKLELGIKLPDSIRQNIIDFVNHPKDTLYPNKINPFDSAQINIVCTFHSPDDRDIVRYGFYYEEYYREISSIDDTISIRERLNKLAPSDPFNIDGIADGSIKGFHSKWLEIPDDYDFRIRFAPDYLGLWLLDIDIYLDGTNYIGNFRGNFEVIPSNNKGFVKLDNNNKNFKFTESGAGSLFLVGSNICHISEMTMPKDYEFFREMIDTIAANNGNFFEVWMTPCAYGIEREDLGNYASKFVPNGFESGYDTTGYKASRQSWAWELDEIIEYATQKDMYLQICMDQPGGDPKDHSWWWMNWDTDSNSTEKGGNPYNANNAANWDEYGNPRIPYLTEYWQFFGINVAKEYYKRKLRYFSSRWGYSTHITSYELHNEINGYGDYNSRLVLVDETFEPWRDVHLKPWLNDVSGYLKYGMKDPHLVTVSIIDDLTQNDAWEPFTVENIDFIDYTKYNYHGGRSTNLEYAGVFKNRMDFFDKPLYIGEYGTLGNFYLPCDRLGFHNDIWSSAFMGTLGVAQIWDWRNHFNLGHFKAFKGVGAFMEGVDFEWNNFTPDTATDELITTSPQTSQQVEIFYLKNQYEGADAQVMGWVHNRSAYWANIRSFADTILIDNDCYFQNDTCDCLDNNPDSVDCPNTSNIILDPCRCANETEEQRSYCPCDDLDCETRENYIYDIENPSVWPIVGLDNEVDYRVEWYSTADGSLVLEDTSEVVLATPAFIVPPMPEEGPYDYAFKIFALGGNFRSTSQMQETADTIELCIDEAHYVRRYLVEDSTRFHIKSVNYRINNAFLWQNCLPDQWFVKAGWYDIVYESKVKQDKVEKHQYVLLVNCEEEESWVSNVINKFDTNVGNDKETLAVNENVYGAIKVVPNPSSGIVSIMVETDGFWKGGIGNIKDAAGRVVMRDIRMDSKVLNIDISYFENGIYYMEMNTENQRFVSKLIKL